MSDHDDDSLLDETLDFDDYNDYDSDDDFYGSNGHPFYTMSGREFKQWEDHDELDDLRFDPPFVQPIPLPQALCTQIAQTLDPTISKETIQSNIEIHNNQSMSPSKRPRTKPYYTDDEYRQYQREWQAEHAPERRHPLWYPLIFARMVKKLFKLKTDEGRVDYLNRNRTSISSKQIKTVDRLYQEMKQESDGSKFASKLVYATGITDVFRIKYMRKMEKKMSSKEYKRLEYYLQTLLKQG